MHKLLRLSVGNFISIPLPKHAGDFEGGVKHSVNEHIPVNEVGHMVEAKRRALLGGIAGGFTNLRGLIGLNPEEYMSPHTRNYRDKILQQFRKDEKSVSDENFNYLAALKEFDRQFIDQKQVAVDMAKLGTVRTYYASVEMPEDMKSIETKKNKLPPLGVYPALLGDTWGEQPIIREAFMQGRRVIMIGDPASYTGEMTEEFAQAEQDGSWKPHVDFYKGATLSLIKELKKQYKINDEEDFPFEIAGYSTSAGRVIPDLLSDPEFAKDILNAYCLAPVSTVNMGEHDPHIGYLREALALIPRKVGFSNAAFTLGKKNPQNEKQLLLRKQVEGPAIRNVTKFNPAWNTARVREGGKIIIVSGEKDTVTQTGRSKDAFINNPNTQYSFLNIRNGYHLSPVDEAEPLWAAATQVAKIEGNSRYYELSDDRKKVLALIS